MPTINNYELNLKSSAELEEHLAYLERQLGILRKKVNDYAAAMSDNISSEALALCDELEKIIKETKELVAKMNMIFEEGMSSIRDTENRSSSNIRNI